MKYRRIILLLLLLPVLSFAESFVAGTDYAVLPEKAWQKPNDKIEVVEFFNYACPWCYKFEPHVEQWLSKGHANVHFYRVAVAFHDQWRLYARAYYTVRALGVENKVNLKIFKAVQEEGKSFSNPEALANYISQFGVSKDDFLNAYHHSPSIDIYQNQGVDLVRRYQISGIPCIVVAGKYKTDSRMVRGDAKRMLKIVEYLVQLSHKKS